jgi:hypothetical protein
LIRHVFLGRWADNVTDAEIDELLSRWRGLQKIVPGVTSIEVGRNEGSNDQKYGFALVADFPGWAQWESYMSHPAHRAVAAELSSRLIDPDSRAAVQFEYGT